MIFKKLAFFNGLLGFIEIITFAARIMSDTND